MRTSYLRISIVLASILSIIGWSCTKIDTTSLGADLIPAVDNVHTFADTLQVIGTQDMLPDSTRLTRSENHLLGSISNDPVFGTTHADLYTELKPAFYPYFFGTPGDTINNAIAPGTGFDSAVLCISVAGFYGDSLKPQSFSAYLLNQNTSNFKDSAYKLDFTPNQPLGQLIGQVTVIPQDVKNFTKFKSTRIPDSVNYQIRIPLTNSFMQSLVANLDTSATGSGNNIYRSDSIFRSLLKGFAIKTDRNSQSNGIFYTTFTDGKSRLEMHYRRKNANRIDTAYSAFYFATAVGNGITAISGLATHLERDRSNSEWQQSPEANALYIQTAPGSAAKLKIPGLPLLDNRIVHRAELIIEQVPSTNSSIAAIDAILPPPTYLYLDLIDTPSTANKFKPIYIDLDPGAYYDPDNSISYLPTNGINFNYFGGVVRRRYDVLSAQNMYYYNFNITRYVQKIVTQKSYSYDFRLSAPYNLYYNGFSTAFQNSLCYGRIKVGNGAHPNYRMKLRIVYSKI
ncbi:MAG: hypothetical protein RLY16_2862 [Bacteroidota bacterium]